MADERPYHDGFRQLGRLLRLLAEEDGPRQPRELHAAMGLSKSSFTRLLKAIRDETSIIIHFRRGVGYFLGGGVPQDVIDLFSAQASEGEEASPPR